MIRKRFVMTTRQHGWLQDYKEHVTKAALTDPDFDLFFEAVDAQQKMNAAFLLHDWETGEYYIEMFTFLLSVINDKKIVLS